MNARLWYPQLDVYDCIRRTCALLHYAKAGGLSEERLYILDFFLANPPLLHRTSMGKAVRAAFRELSIPSLEKSFLTYPAAPLLFHKMEPVQKEAVRGMAGKGLLSHDALTAGDVTYSASGRDIAVKSIWPTVTDDEKQISQFLVETFAGSQGGGISELRTSTGLRRAA